MEVLTQQKLSELNNLMDGSLSQTSKHYSFGFDNESGQFDYITIT